MDLRALPEDEKERILKRSFVRLVFGVLQISGATGAMYLLFTIGPEPATLIMTGATLTTSLLSRVVFRKDAPPRKEP